MGRLRPSSGDNEQADDARPTSSTVVAGLLPPSHASLAPSVGTQATRQAGEAHALPPPRQAGPRHRPRRRKHRSGPSNQGRAWRWPAPDLVREEEQRCGATSSLAVYGGGGGSSAVGAEELLPAADGGRSSSQMFGARQVGRVVAKELLPAADGDQSSSRRRPVSLRGPCWWRPPSLPPARAAAEATPPLLCAMSTTSLGWAQQWHVVGPAEDGGDSFPPGYEGDGG
jgi:hypothetical protein